MGSPSLLVVLCAAALCAGLGKRAAAEDLKQGDAYLRESAGGRQWTLGTKGFRQVLEFRDGELRLVSYQNRLTRQPIELATPGAKGTPFTAGDGSADGRFRVQPVWSHFLRGGATVDMAAQQIRIPVKAGDLIGFSLGAHGDYTCDETEWVITVAYPEGESYVSSQDTELGQGPVWHYFLRRPGTGWMEPLDSVEAHDYAGQKVRIPSPGSGWRAAGGCPHIGPTKCHPSNSFEAVRAWKAPHDGTVLVTGSARQLGGGDVDLAVLKLEPKPAVADPSPEAWALEKSALRRVAAGGRPALELEISLRQGALRAVHHALVYPGTAILRQWLEVENVGKEPTTASVRPLSLALEGDGNFTHTWMVGGNSKADQGVLKRGEVRGEYHQVIAGQATREHVPWMAVQRDGGERDGWFCALEYLGPWRLTLSRWQEVVALSPSPRSVGRCATVARRKERLLSATYFDRAAAGPLRAAAEAPDLEALPLGPGERRRLPEVTLGVFQGDLDDMAARLYDWQYEYLWDDTNPDYYARPKWAVPWVYCSRNLQEQFTSRVAGLGMDADLMREMGFEMLWDDAGWSSYPGWPEDNYGSVFRNTYEGPDFSHTLRHLSKMEMRWLLWFAGRPTSGLMDTKVGSWGNFEWRTDAVDFPGLASDQELRARICHFLDAHPRCSFHTCSGGSTYAHTFEIQRFANTNYFADFGRGPETNAYFSYLDPPDKWVDIIEPWSTGGKYRPETARQLLTMVPMWGLYAAEPDREPVRRIVEIYHYLLREGVAGRWSYVCHPVVKGDHEFTVFQRLSRDRGKSCLILKHRAPGPITLFPRGLLPEHAYVVGFDSTRETTVRTGADLMANGIVLREQAPGELIYLGLPNRPGGGGDDTPPTAPGRALCRRETNLGHPGVAVTWSPAHDDHWVSFYEVRRGETLLGKASTGCCFFDHAPGWDPGAAYAVRAVDGDGNRSAWTAAEPIAGEPLTASALGGHFSQQGRDGWSAETTVDGAAFVPMTFVAPVKTPAGDLGGTPNQVGGIEGYWEGPGGARVGRGWQQASTEAACVRTWTAPQAGTIRVVGRAMKEWYRQGRGGALRVRILHGTQPIWPHEGPATVGSNNLVGAVHDFTVTVAAGDAIRFVLEPGHSVEDDLIAWMPRIVTVEDAPPAGGSVARIRCGARRPYTDRCGNVWDADRCFRGGRPMAETAGFEAAQPTPEDAALYARGREGSDFAYAIPVQPGLYSVRLKLAEPRQRWAFERPMNLEINGRRVLTDFDVVHATGSPRRACERVFRYLVPDAEGRLVLRFTGGSAPTQRTRAAMVQAIEVLPEVRPSVRIDCGSGQAFPDWSSLVWSADESCGGGRAIRSDAPVSQASPTLYDQALYQTAASGRMLRYAIPVPPGLYAVHLKFAELWLAEPGKRPMGIAVNGRRVRQGWDPAAAAGQVGMSADLRVEDVAPDSEGRIVIEVAAEGANDAILQGIEVE